MAFTITEANVHTLLDKIRTSATEDDTLVTIRRTADADAAKRYEVAVYRAFKPGVPPAFKAYGSTLTAAYIALITAIKNDFNAQATTSGAANTFQAGRNTDLTTLLA